ncbi:hypothetical protein Cpir12675_003645 [Ceratocystis pirilliformis]|uniref:BHLH domain-containing protein n=1 Tax=Ceratocystis pirilliformis TaxID=259994 RepID=A0ABR3Z1Q1_9PEZI
MTTTLSQSPLDYYNKQTLGQYGLSPTSPFADQAFAQFDNDIWHHQQQAQLQAQAQVQATAQAQVQTQAQMAHQSQPKFYISPKAVMPRTSSESPSLLPLDLEAASFGDSLGDPMFQSSPPLDASQMLFQQFTSPPTAAPVSASTTITGSNSFDFLGSPTFSIHTSPMSHRKTVSNASSSCSMRSSLSPPPRPSKVSTTANSHNQVQSQTRNQSGSSRRTTLPPKKTTHNMIEKRYRNNLNDKIAALRDSIPAMRVMVHRLENQMLAGGNNGEFVDDEDAAEHREDLDGLEPASKVNKATILSKATEYIAHLEAKNKALAMENADLKTRVSSLEALWK